MGLPVLASIVSEALGTIKHPAAQVASKSLGQVSDALSMGQITPEQMAEANRHAEKMAEVAAQENVAAYQQVNESLRAEVASSDPYVRRMRPTFGYLMAVTWAAQMLALAYVIVFETAQADIVLQSMESLGTIWMVGLSVLGIYVYKRSEEKRTIAPRSVDQKAQNSVASAPSVQTRQNYKVNE
jgi:hypothetical protein